MIKESESLSSKLPSISELKKDMWDLASISYDEAGFSKAGEIFDKYRKTFDARFPDQKAFSDETSAKIELYKESAADLGPDCITLVHLLISTILQEYASVKRDNLELFGKEGRDIMDQAIMDIKFTGIIKKIDDGRNLPLNTSLKTEIQTTVGEVVGILSTATHDTLYYKIIPWHNKAIDDVITKVGSEENRVKKQASIEEVLTDTLGKLWGKVNSVIPDESKRKVTKFAKEMAEDKDGIRSYERKGRGEGLRKSKKALNRLGVALGFVEKDGSFSDFMKHQYRAVHVLKREAEGLGAGVTAGAGVARADTKTSPKGSSRGA